MTTATKITIARIAFLPLILFFYLSASFINEPFFILNGKLIALILFVVAATTDWLDGWVARKFNQISDMGKFLDPIADKMLTTLGFILVATDFDVVGELLPLWFAVLAVFVAVGRDIVINALRLIAVEKGVTIAADKSGKIKSAMQFVAISMLMFYAVDFVNGWLGLDLVFDIFGYVTLFALSLATVLSVYSGGHYLVKYKDVFGSGGANARLPEKVEKQGGMEEQQAEKGIKATRKTIKKTGTKSGKTSEMGQVKKTKKTWEEKVSG